MERNRTQKSAINLFVAVITQCLNMLLSFVVRTIFISTMEVEYLGIGGLFSNILTVLSLAELGVGDALVFAMYKPMKEQNWDEMRQLLGLAKRIYRVMAIVVACIGILSSFFLDYMIKEMPNIKENIQSVFFLYMLNLTCSYFLAYKSLFLIANQSQCVVSLVSQGTKILQQLLQMLVLLVLHNYYVYLLCQVFCTVLNNFLILIYIRKRFPCIREERREKFPKKKLEIILKNVSSLSVSKIAGVIATGTDNIVISKCIGLVEVGLVSNYNLIINAINGILWQGIRALMGSIGNFNVDSTIEKRKCVFDQL